MKRTLKPGDRVVLAQTEECGIVISTWTDAELGERDCYVAFFGDVFPQVDSRPALKPYVLRYMETSLILQK